MMADIWAFVMDNNTSMVASNRTNDLENQKTEV